jgi:hypothetical protein
LLVFTTSVAFIGRRDRIKLGQKSRSRRRRKRRKRALASWRAA